MVTFRINQGYSGVNKKEGATASKITTTASVRERNTTRFSFLAIALSVLFVFVNRLADLLRDH